MGSERIVAISDNPAGGHWIKIKNPKYSQKEGREDLFKKAGLIAPF